jgi:hypothetical protein
MNIPTAEEFIKKNLIDYWEGGKAQYTWEDVERAMKEFAKLHVEAALQDASEKSTVIRDEEFYTISHVNKNSILNAYPLTNIK